MAIRYSDFLNSSARSDFIPRGRQQKLFAILMVLMFLLAMGITTMVLLLDKITLIACLCLMLLGASWYVFTEVVRFSDLVLATEFQNALFASALGFSNKFCLIIKREGGVVYTDNGFQKMFPELAKERMVSVDGMLKHGKVAQIDQEKIFTAISHGVYDKVIFNIRGENGQMLKVVMSLEPIIRPSGFIMLRGREFIEKRAGEVSTDDGHSNVPSNPLLHKSSITLFSYVMDRMNTGVYVTDPSGVVIYANRLIERWLSYNDMEIVTAKLALKDIIHHVGAGLDTISPENFEGEAALRKKEGGLVKAFINQKVILGEAQEVLGCVAMINNMVEVDPSMKKTLW